MAIHYELTRYRGGGTMKNKKVKQEFLRITCNPDDQNITWKAQGNLKRLAMCIVHLYHKNEKFREAMVFAMTFYESLTK
jgi:hypothetical protein